MAVFVLVLVSAAVLLSRMQGNMNAANDKNVLANSAVAAFDSLAYSPGYPVDWSPENVSSVGLATIGGWTKSSGASKRIDVAKLLRYAKLNYSTARDLLGLSVFEMRLSFHDSWNSSERAQALARPAAFSGVLLEPIAYYAESESDAFAFLNGKNLSWDYYWAGSGGAPPAGDARAFYSAGDYGGKAALFNALFANASALGAPAYRSVVVEQPNFTAAEYGSVNQTLLRDYLKARGLLVLEGSFSAADEESEALLLDDLNASVEFVFGGQTGAVNQTGFFLDNASAGDAVSFSQSKWSVYSNASRGDAVVFVFVQNESDSSRALAAEWSCENGRVYYAASFDASFGENATPGSSVFNLVGARLDFGVEPDASATDVFVVQRPVVIQRDWGSLSVGELVVWRKALS